MKWIQYFIVAIVLNQMISFGISLFITEKKEKPLFHFTFFSVLLNNIFYFTALFIWLYLEFPKINFELLKLYQYHHYLFNLEVFIDKVTMVFLLVGNLITLMIAYFSRFYMHREKGFKRFFNTILFFHLAYTLTTMAGNFITMFVGWEFLGISSFLLIAFYRERYLPVRNAVKVFSVYRIGDIGFIMGIWAVNQIVHQNINFSIITLPEFVKYYLSDVPFIQTLIALCFLLAAVVKSAQFPFTYWIARAMEGPTPSSAIFYGSLSIHMGLLLLLRTYYIWEEMYFTRILFSIIGLITIFISSTSARVQASIKAQVAYSSAAQIGFMFIELAFGWNNLVLIHFVSNAFLRTYQLLTSPSVAAYLMRKQMYFSKHQKINTPSKFLSLLNINVQRSIYVLAQKEINMDFYVNKYLFGTLKLLGKQVNFINVKSVLFIFIPLLILGWILKVMSIDISFTKKEILPMIMGIIALMLTLRSYVERHSVVLSLYLIVISQLYVLLSVSFNEMYPFSSMLLYLSGIVFGLLICSAVIFYLQNKEPYFIDLNKYYGHIYQYRWLGFVFLFGILCMIGFPITPTFIGEDIILEHIHLHQFTLTFFIAFVYIISGIQGIRMYARIFLGPHIKQYHEVAIKSA